MEIRKKIGSAAFVAILVFSIFATIPFATAGPDVIYVPDDFPSIRDGASNIGIITNKDLAPKSMAPEEEWNKTFGGTDGDLGSSVQRTPDGGYITAGATASFGAGSGDVYLIKTGLDTSNNVGRRMKIK